MSGAGLRLDFDFTPLFMSGASIRKAAKGRWPGIRRRLLADQGSVCEACGFIAQEARLIHGHEVFEYDLAAKKVRLIRIALLCFKCHNCKHFEHFSVLHGLGTFTSQNPEDLIAHFCTVNGCSRSDFEAHFRAATERRELLDSTFGANFQGEIDYGVYAEAVAQAKTRRARFPRKEKPKKPVVLTPEQEQKLAEWRAIRDKWQADYDASLRWHEIFSGLSRKRDARIVAVITGVSKHRPAGFKLFYVDEEVASLGDRFLTRPGLRERGWTDGQIRRLLNTCDVAPRRNAMDAPLYAEARVAALEKANTKVRDGVRLRRAVIARCEKAVRKAIEQFQQSPDPPLEYYEIWWEAARGVPVTRKPPPPEAGLVLVFDARPELSSQPAVPSKVQYLHLMRFEYFALPIVRDIDGAFFTMNALLWRGWTRTQMQRHLYPCDADRGPFFSRLFSAKRVKAAEEIVDVIRARVVIRPSWEDMLANPRRPDEADESYRPLTWARRTFPE